MTLFCGLVYISIQQTVRLGANDPQIQIAIDLKNYLDTGTSPSQLPYDTKLDIRMSYSPFVIIYDNAGIVINSSGEMDGKTPILPKGVLDNVKMSGESRISWQPDHGVREATVVLKYKNGYVLVARSLKEAKELEDLVFKFALMAWSLGIGAVSIVFLIFRYWGKKK